MGRTHSKEVWYEGFRESVAGSNNHLDVVRVVWMDVVLKTRTCNVCEVEKPLTDYYNPMFKDGVRRRRRNCKTCVTQQMITKNRKYPENDKVIRGRANLKSIMKTPERHLAPLALNCVVRSGDIEKPSICEECGKSNKRIEAHHTSYKKKHWLRVMWLCTKCHGEWHRGRKYNRKTKGFDYVGK